MSIIHKMKNAFGRTVNFIKQELPEDQMQAVLTTDVTKQALFGAVQQSDSDEKQGQGFISYPSFVFCDSQTIENRHRILSELSDFQAMVFGYLFLTSRMIQDDGINKYEKEAICQIIENIADYLRDFYKKEGQELQDNKSLVLGVVYLINHRTDETCKTLLKELGLDNKLPLIIQATQEQNELDYLFIMQKFCPRSVSGRRFYLECVLSDSKERLDGLANDLEALYHLLVEGDLDNISNINQSDIFVYGLEAKHGWGYSMVNRQGLFDYTRKLQSKDNADTASNQSAQPKQETTRTVVFLYDYIVLGDHKPVMLLAGVNYLQEQVSILQNLFTFEKQDGSFLPENPTVNNADLSVAQHELDLARSQTVPYLHIKTTNTDGKTNIKPKKVESFDINNVSTQEDNIAQDPRQKTDTKQWLDPLFMHNTSDSMLFYIG